MSHMTNFIRSTSDPPKSLLRKDTELEIDIKYPKLHLKKIKIIKQLETSTVIRDEQRESKEPMTADDTDNIGKIKKKR